MKRTVLAAIILSVAGLMTTSRSFGGDPAAVAAPPEEHYIVPVERTRVELRTYAVGSFRPRDKVVIPAPIHGKVEWVIEEGTLVRKGAEVARVDCTEHVERLEKEKLALAVVQAELDRARIEEQLVHEQLAFEVEKAGLELEATQLARDVLGDPTPTDVALSQLTVDETRFSMEAAGKEYNRFKKLGEKGIESGRNIALARLKHEGARADYLKAAADHELLLKGDPKEDIAVADQELERARTKLKLARQRLKSQAAFQVTQVKVAEVAVKRVQSIIDLQQERIDRSRVTAPADGVVLHPRYWGVPLRVGDQVWRSNRFLDISDMSVMTIEAIVNQVDWHRVKTGQPVEIRLVAFPGKLFHGVVRKVGRLARDRSLILGEDITGVMSFHVGIDVTERAPELRASYTARLAIITDRIDDCIAVPRPAVTRRDDGVCVMVRTDDGFAWRPVKTGPADARHIVIEGGLEVGDRVVVPGGPPSEAP